MIKRFLPALISLLLAAPILYSQEEWVEYSSANSVNAIAEEGDTLWLATQTGLVQFNRKTHKNKLYTRVSTKLPTAEINDIAVDKNGVKWMSTIYGLVRFDGSWMVYNTSNTPLSSHYIRTLCIGPDNTIWLTTRNEMASFKDNTWKLYDFKQHPCLRYISHIYSNEQGVLWLGSSYDAEPCFTAYRWIGGEMHPIHDSLSARDIKDITQKNGVFWFATSRTEQISAPPAPSEDAGALVRYDGVKADIYSWQSAGFDKAYPFHRASIDSSGGVWVITETGAGGAAHFDGTAWTTYPGKNLPVAPKEKLNTIITDSDGVMWIGTQRSGLLYFDGSAWKNIPYFGFGFFWVSSIAVDSDQRLWSAHYAWDVDYDPPFCTRFSGSNAETIHTPVVIRQIAINSRGVKWFVSDKGRFFRLTGNSWTELEGERVTSILYIDRSDHLWARMYHGAVKRFDGTTWTDLSTMVPAGFGTCSAVTQDRNGTLWFGTTKGLWAYNGAWTHYPRSPQELPDGGLGGLSIACDSSNNIWLGSYAVGMINDGLDRFDGTTWTRFHGADTLPLTLVSSIATDRKGNVWVSGHTLQKFDGTTWTQFDYGNSPISRPSFRLIVDSNNTLWMHNTHSIMGYRPGGIVASAGEAPSGSPGDVSLHSYPNPASSLTTISYAVPAGIAQHVHLKIYNALGTELATLADRVQTPGEYSVEFDTSTLPAGVYYYQLQTGNTTTSRQMVVVK